MKHTLQILVLLLSINPPSFASDNDFKKEINHVDSATVNMKLRLELRAEAGDLTFTDKNTYESEFDAYLRRIRLGFFGKAFFENLHYALTFAADETDKGEAFGEESGIIVSSAYLRYTFSEALQLQFGKTKLPFSRVYLTSSSRQLFVERPVYTIGLREFFRRYVHTNLQLIGHFREGTIGYKFAVGTGWRPGSKLYGEDAVVIDSADPYYVGRLELSPHGWVEDKMSDAHIGKGKHLTFGLYTASQDGLEYRDMVGSEKRTLFGADVSYHNKNVTLQTEYNEWKIDTQLVGKYENPRSWYIQGGYLFSHMQIEPTIRYELFDSNQKAEKASASILTLGMNKYFKGHNLKLGINWEHTVYDDNFSMLRPVDRDRKDVVRVSLQYKLKF
jgi:phosphate-selective porin OprO/OprP